MIALLIDMNKPEILEKLNKFSDPGEKDSGYQMVEFLKVSEKFYFENKKEITSIIKDWLNENDKPHLQILSIVLIRNCKIKELMGEVLILKQNYIMNRSMPYLKDDIKIINETILSLVSSS